MVEPASMETEGVAEVVGVSNADAPALLTTPQDMADAVPGVVAHGVQAAEDEDGADAVIMGGGPLSASAFRLQPQYDVPLVVAVNAAARAALAAITEEE